MKTVSVIPLKKGVFKDNLTYFSKKDVYPGDIVLIELRGKKVLGLVAGVEDVGETKSEIKKLPFGLKRIEEVKDKSIFRTEFLESALLFCSYSAGVKSSILSALLPSALKESYDKILAEEKKNVSAKSANEGNKNIKSEKLLFQSSLSDRISYYKTLIRESFANKKSVFIVLPTEHDIEVFYELLHRGIENFIISVHGGLPAKKQIEKFELAIGSSHPILILGTPQYLSIPRTDIGTIIIEKESSGSFRSMDRARFDFRIFAEIFASKIGARFILADTLLRFETIARKSMDHISEMRPLSYRLNEENCEIEIIDKQEKDETKKKWQVLSTQSENAIRKALETEKNIFVFALRKGLATITICRDCGETLLCDKCSSPIVLYLSRNSAKRMYVCNRCRNEKSPETSCRNCGSWNLIPLGIGTDTVFAELEKIFPKAKLFKLDKESVKSPKQAGKIITEFNKNSGAILVGTEMALFYFEGRVPFSVVASFDSLWSIPNYKMSEKILGILSSLLAKTENKLIIETKNPGDPILQAIDNENLSPLIREELHVRETLGYPPYKRFIKITFSGNKEETIKAKGLLSEILKEYNPEVFSGFVAKQKDKYITNALIRINREDWSFPELIENGKIDKKLLEKLLVLQPNFSINVDPEDLL